MKFILKSISALTKVLTGDCRCNFIYRRLSLLTDQGVDGIEVCSAADKPAGRVSSPERGALACQYLARQTTN